MPLSCVRSSSAGTPSLLRWKRGISILWRTGIRNGKANQLIFDISYFSCLWGKLIMLTREYNHTQCYSRVLHLALCKIKLHWLIHCIYREWLVSQKSEFTHDPIDFTWSSRYILFTLVVWWDVALALGNFHSAPECTYCIPIKMQRPNQANHTSQIFRALCNSPRKKAKSS